MQSAKNWLCYNAADKLNCARKRRVLAQSEVWAHVVVIIANAFSSRQAHRLTYPSQRKSPAYRALARAFKARSKLGDKGDIGDGLVRPKRMHHKTFERLQAIVDDYDAIMVEAINKRKPKSKRRSF
jgi:hypothetical protein